MRAILDLVSPAATLVEALEPIRSEPHGAAVLLDIDGTLAPIVRHAADAHVPEATRSLLIAIAGRYRLVGCVSGRRAATARHAPRDRRRSRSLDGADARFRRSRVHPRGRAHPRALRGQGDDRRVS